MFLYAGVCGKFCEACHEGQEFSTGWGMENPELTGVEWRNDWRGENSSGVVSRVFSFRLELNSSELGLTTRLEWGMGFRFLHWGGFLWDWGKFFRGEGSGMYRQVMGWNAFAAGVHFTFAFSFLENRACTGADWKLNWANSRNG